MIPHSRECHEATIGGERVHIYHADLSDGTPGFWPSTGEYDVYDAFHYDLMADDHARNAIYREAIEILAPGKTVLDVGTGALALWALEAAEAGASRVYAIEASKDAAEKARQAVKRRNFDSVITVIEGVAPEVELPERVDLIISELIGEIASSESAPEILSPISRRYLKPGGLQIPCNCSTMAALVELTPALLENPTFDSRSLPYIEQIWNKASQPFDLRLTIENPADQFRMLSQPFELEDLQFGSSPAIISPLTEIRSTVSANGSANGVLAWIELKCHSDKSSLASLSGESHWMPVLFPLTPLRFPVTAGDEFSVQWLRTFESDSDRADFSIGVSLPASSGSQELHSRLELPYRGRSLGQSSLHRALMRRIQ